MVCVVGKQRTHALCSTVLPCGDLYVILAYDVHCTSTTTLLRRSHYVIPGSTAQRLQHATVLADATNTWFAYALLGTAVGHLCGTDISMAVPCNGKQAWRCTCGRSCGGAYLCTNTQQFPNKFTSLAPGYIMLALQDIFRNKGCFAVGGRENGREEGQRLVMKVACVVEK